MLCWLLFISQAFSQFYSFHGSLDPQSYSFTKFFLGSPASTINVSTSFASLSKERTSIVIKYGGLPLVEEWQVPLEEEDPVVWGGPGALRIEIQDAREGWYFVGVFDTSGLDTQAHQLSSGPSFDFTIDVYLTDPLVCRTLPLQGDFEAPREIFARNIVSLQTDCYQFFVPDFTERVEIYFLHDNASSLSATNVSDTYVRWKGRPSSFFHTTSDSFLEFPSSGWWYLITSSPFIPTIHGLISPLVPAVPIAVSYDDAIFTDWRLGSINDTLFVLELNSNSVGGELRLVPQTALYRSLNTSEPALVEAGKVWFRPVAGTYILSLTTKASAIRKRHWSSFVGASHSAAGSVLLASLAGSSSDEVVEEQLAVGDTLAYMAQCPSDCFGRGNCGVKRGVVTFAVCWNCVRFSGLACEREVISLPAYTGMVLLLVFSNLAILPATYRAHKMKLHFEATVYACVCLGSALYHLCDEGCFCVASYSSLHLLDFLLSFYAIVVTVVYSVGHSGWSKDVANLVALLVLVFANSQNSTLGVYLPFGILLTTLMFLPLVRDRALLLPPFHNRIAWCGLLGAGFLLIVALTCQYAIVSNNNYFYVHSIWHFCVQLCPLLCVLWRRGPEAHVLQSSSQLDTPLHEKESMAF